MGSVSGSPWRRRDAIDGSMWRLDKPAGCPSVMFTPGFPQSFTANRAIAGEVKHFQGQFLDLVIARLFLVALSHRRAAARKCDRAEVWPAARRSLTVNS